MNEFDKYLVSHSKTGGKFWAVKVEGCDVKTRYGKIGQDKQWSVKTFDTPEKALSEAQKKFRQKTNKGYSENSALEDWDIAIRIDALEAAYNERQYPDSSDRFERGNPLTNDELQKVEDHIGYTLDTRFVAFFRVCNGLVLKYGHHIINVPTLMSIFWRGGFEVSYAPGEHSVKMLGGWDLHNALTSMHDIDDYLYLKNPQEPSYYRPALVAHAQYPDPPVIMTSDYDAAIDDHHPMLARHYLDLVIATAGLSEPRHACLKNNGFGGNHALFLPPENWLAGFPKAHDVLNGKAQSALNALGYPGRDASTSEYATYNTTSV